MSEKFVCEVIHYSFGVSLREVYIDDWWECIFVPYSSIMHIVKNYKTELLPQNWTIL